MSLAATAKRILQKRGEAVVITRPGGVDRDPATGDVIGSLEPLNINGFGYPGQYEADDVDGTVIRSSDTRLVLERIVVRPEVGWDALVDGKTHRIMSVQPVRKSGQDIIYICQLRAS